MTTLDKAFRPGRLRGPDLRGWEESRRVRRTAGQQRGALHHHDPAAERHRQPAYGPRADLHAAGHADPLAADAGARRAVAAGHRPCRHRHADGGGAAAGPGRRPRRKALGREAFLERVWQWKAESGGTITRQLRRLGASLDWPRERFTMDDGLSAAVREVFVRLYERRADLRDRRLVNWDPKLQTAISDLEVESREIKGHLWHIRYPVEGGGEIIVATTRPETMLGDTAVAVHPEDATLHGSDRQAGDPAAGRAAHPDRRR